MKLWIFVWFCAYGVCLAQTKAAPGAGIPASDDRVLSKRVAHFTMVQGTVYDGLKQLSNGAAPFAFGFEETLKEKFSDPDIQAQRFGIKLENKTTREILDALCASDPRYMWSFDSPAINVYPRATISDETYFMNRVLPRLNLVGVTDIDQGLLSIVHQLPSPTEQVAHVQMGGESSYPSEPWNQSFTALTVRQAVNRLVAHMGQRACWTFHGSRDFRAFTFFKAGFPEE